MGTQIDELSHSCGTKRALKVFLEQDGKVTGYCFACSNFVESPYGNEEFKVPEKKVKSPEQIEREMTEIAGYKVLDVPQRKLRAATLKKFGARVSVSEADGVTPTAIYWPLTRKGDHVGWHVKGLIKNDKGKSFVYNVGSAKEVDFIGWEEALASGAYRLFITEGPEDMASIDRIYEMHGDKSYTPAVVSLPAGAGSAKKVLQKHSADILRTFKDVVLCFDNDKVGQEAVKEAMLVLPTAKSVVLPCKDANDCLVQGKAKAACTALSFKAVIPKNTRIVFGESLHEKAREQAQYGQLSWPWPGIQEATRGIRYGETYYLGAGVKMGKSEMLNALAAHFIKNHDVPVFMAKPEEGNAKTYKLLAGKMVSRVFHDPKVEFDYAAYDRAGEILRGKLAVLNLYQHLGWDALRADIASAVDWGAKAIFVDPITNLTNGINAAEANVKLQETAQEMSAMAKDMDFAAFLFCHLKAPEGNISRETRLKNYKDGKFIGLGNCPHELGGDVSSAQFAGSRAMMR